MLAVGPHSIAGAAALSLLAAGVWSLTLHAAFTGSRAKRYLLGVGPRASIGGVAGFVAMSAISLWVPGLDLSVAQLAAIAVLVVASVMTWEIFLDRALPATQRVLIVGAGPSCADLVEAVAAQPPPALTIVGIADDDRSDGFLAGVPIQGRIADLPDLVERFRPSLVVVAVERNRPEVFARLLEAAGAGFTVVGLPEFYEQMFGRLPVRYLTPAWFMSVLHLYQKPYSRLVKRAFDLTVALAGIFVTAPLFPLIALLVRATTSGPALFSQLRIGEDGRLFMIHKFRTMRVDAEADGAAIWAEERDPRATPLGRLLRKTRLDELPQLWNVVKGDMSIVGPRPERPEYLMLLQETVPFWTTRHLLKPGITGWAQVSTGYAADSAATELKLSYDLWYLRHASLAVDLLVCAKTLKRLVYGSGAR